MEAVFWLAFYGALAAAALWATCRDRDLFWVGFWLVGSYLASNGLWALGVPSVDRPGAYTLLEILVALAAFVAWDAHGSRCLTFLVACNVLSICANIAFASISHPEWGQVYAWEVTVNLCFAVECLFAIICGVSHGRRVGRFRHWSSRRWRAARADGAYAAEEQQP